MSARRLLKELEDFKKSSEDGLSFAESTSYESLRENPCSEWHIAVEGVAGTMFEGKYVLCFMFPNEYPFRAPKFKFIAPIIPTHPCIKLNGEFKGRVDPKSGLISHYGMDENWSPKWTIHKLCLYLRWALAYFKHGKVHSQITMAFDFDVQKFARIQNIVPFELELDFGLNAELFEVENAEREEGNGWKLPVRPILYVPLPSPDVILSYHGTTATSVVSILEQGFMPNHGAYGFGVYFSPKANIALSYSSGTVSYKVKQ